MSYLLTHPTRGQRTGGDDHDHEDDEHERHGARKGLAGGHGLARLTGQDLTHPTQEPCEGGDGLDDHDAHEDKDDRVGSTNREATGNDLELGKERAHGGHAGDSGRGDRKAHARDRVLLHEALDLGQHTGSQREAEGAGDEEEQGLGERVVEDVLDGAVERHLASEHGEAQAEEHVGELRDRREGEQALHILLGQVHEEAEEHGHDGVDDGDPTDDLGDIAGTRKSAGEHAHADLNHGRAMKVGGNGRGGLHCGGQPHVERELGGLGPSSEQDEQQHDGLLPESSWEIALSANVPVPANRKAAPM